jgi:flagellar basal-body rod modification protein FlgD
MNTAEWKNRQTNLINSHNLLGGKQVSTINQTYGANGTGMLNSIGSAGDNTVMGQDDFLAMLVTQLSYQDPLSPMDSQQFAAQLAQFTTVEQLTSINQNLQDSLQAQMLLNQSINNSMSAQLIGLDARALNETIVLDDGEATPIMYNLSGNATVVSIKIYDEDGAEVKSVTLAGQPIGDHTYEWDGTNNVGAALPEGQYTFTVTAETSEGNSLEVEQFITGLITGVQYSGGSAQLMMGNLPILLANVSQLSQPDEG